jgi:hypothetical protein
VTPGDVIEQGRALRDRVDLSENIDKDYEDGSCVSSAPSPNRQASEEMASAATGVDSGLDTHI